MIRIVPACALAAFLMYAPIVAAQENHAGEEFRNSFYNATQCVHIVREEVNGNRTVTAKNLCRAQIAVLGCFKILKATSGYAAPGWYCEYSNVYSAGTKQILSRLGIYDRRLKAAACSVGNRQCDNALRTILVRVEETRRDPEEISKKVRPMVQGGS